MKQLTILNHFKQWKVSYGEDYYWKLGARWYKDTPLGMQLIDKELAEEIEKIWFVKAQTW